MRNTTKLKQILLKYDLALSMEDEGLLRLSLVDKTSGKIISFEHTGYSQLIGKAYSQLLKDVKTNPARPSGKKTRGLGFPEL